MNKLFASLVLFILIIAGSSSLSVTHSAQSWETEWQQTLKAAKDEGTVAVLGPPGNDVRTALTEGFQRAFPGIKVGYTGARGAIIMPRLLAERRAGHYLADLYIGNPHTAFTNLFPAKALDPIKPALLLPEVVDPGQWWRGELEYADRRKSYNIVFHTNVMTHVALNPQLVKTGEIRSHVDLLNSKWRGKMVVSDPRIGGPGIATMGFWYLHPDLGKDFIRKFFKDRKLTISRNYRQTLEWVAKGRYSLAVGPSELLSTELIAKQLPLRLLHSDRLKEGGLLNAGFGSVVLLNRAPHPNAAKVYINWLLSRDGQAKYSKASGYPSRRMDVSRDQFDPGSLPKEGERYILGYGERFSRTQREVRNLVRPLLQRKR